MSQFDKYTVPEYIECLRGFLKMKKGAFLSIVDVTPDSGGKSVHRLSHIPEATIQTLEIAVNAKGVRCEAGDTTLGERYRLARDYCGLLDSHVARELGVSRELVRRWGENIHRPTCVDSLASLLNVPQKWLEEGGFVHLPANSHLGVRVGDEAVLSRKQLYVLMVDVHAEIPEESSDDYKQAYMERAVMTRSELSHASRRAGGRWHLIGTEWSFCPWVPLPPERPLQRRYWSDEVELIISEELATNSSVYAAWQAVKIRCEEKGLEYPQRVSLHKRVQRITNRKKKYGINMNALIAETCRHYEPIC
jgi:DNA-binding transcriptional regulator YiaG